jgi:glycosyltransferase involved in cell wall biosynthesis
LADARRLRYSSVPVKVAVIHDWLDTWRGGEAVLVEILRIYPDADLFALVDFLPDSERRGLRGRRTTTSFLQRMPFARTTFRMWLPLFPRAIESLDVGDYDLVISSSHAVAKGVRTRPGQMHVCYCYTPMRYAWDLREQYLQQTGLDRGATGALADALLARLRAWDRATSERVDEFVAISRHIAARIQRCYARDSSVIYPPVSVPHVPADLGREDVYVTVSHLVPYKRVDLLIDAFRRMPARKLVVIGGGRMGARLARTAPGNVRLLGRVSDAERNAWLARARAFVFAAQEDFGIAPLEAQALGTPVIAYAGGAARETIRDLDQPSPSGVLFEQQSVDSIVAAVDRFEAHGHAIATGACRENAMRFGAERFRREFSAFVDAKLALARQGAAVR